MARNLVNLEGVGKSYGTRTLLDDVSLGVAEGDRIGSSGATATASRRCCGCSPARAAGRRAGHPRRRPARRRGRAARRPRPRRDGARAGRRRRARARVGSDAGVRDVLAGLFGDRARRSTPCSTARRPAVRRRAPPGRAGRGAGRASTTCCVLDEPTNHLDVEGIDWLAEHLAGRREALVVVTHDRWFLDAVCTAHLGGAGRRGARVRRRLLGVRARPGRARADAGRRPTRGAHNLLRKELAWLRRGPPARTSKPQFRIDAANALIADEPPPRDGVELVRFASAPARQDRLRRRRTRPSQVGGPGAARPT